MKRSNKRPATRARTKRKASNRRHQPVSVAPLAVAFDHFNQELFDGILKRPVLKILPLRSSLGRFSFDGCRNTTEDTISIDIHYLRRESQAEVLSTLVHEMCHQWQSNHGKMGRRSGYHNLQWAAKMEECGLMASDTGKPGGKKNGPRVSHYIINGGVFEQACSRLPEGFVLYQLPTLAKVKPKVKPQAKAKAKTVTRPRVIQPAPVAPVSFRPQKKRRQKRPLTFAHKGFLAIKRIFQLAISSAHAVLLVLIVITFLLTLV